MKLLSVLGAVLAFWPGIVVGWLMLTQAMEMSIVGHIACQGYLNG